MNIIVDTITHPEVKALMVKFFNESEQLYIDMDNLTSEEYKIRLKQMWSLRNQASEIDGDLFIISLYGLEEKAERLFG